MNRVLFPPNALNLQIYKKYNQTLRRLLEQWWDKICTSKKIAEHAGELEAYRQSLQAGDLTLLGLITDGGQGLATADNGRFVGAIAGSTVAARIMQTRPVKFLEAIQKNRISSLKHITGLNEAREYLAALGEAETRELFDKLKAKYGRDIFGQGYLYRIVSPDEIAEVEKLTEKEKEKGIGPGKPHFVPYDKGDKEGNRWFLQTPFYIDWSKENVAYLSSSPRARWQGYNFFFREGFCWTDVNSTYLKCRMKTNGVHDVLSMSLFSQCRLTPDWYLVCLINSKYISEFVDDFLNNTSHFQINDARQLPIIIPNQQQLQDFESLFNQAYGIKVRQFSGELSEPDALYELEQVQKRLDEMVYRLYDIEL
ncbi:hypothetical protein [Syntrophomonas palmitatica]|uniref:hypothetical protein n=1 Tax=Syntrophomonas palmitatica TaxID=402877 RepID=UPI0006D19AB9|nr:hypothetical protein [Syntrophomonas palmitatica]